MSEINSSIPDESLEDLCSSVGRYLERQRIAREVPFVPHSLLRVADPSLEVYIDLRDVAKNLFSVSARYSVSLHRLEGGTLLAGVPRIDGSSMRFKRTALKAGDPASLGRVKVAFRGQVHETMPEDLVQPELRDLRAGDARWVAEDDLIFHRGAILVGGTASVFERPGEGPFRQVTRLPDGLASDRAVSAPGIDASDPALPVKIVGSSLPQLRGIW